MRAAVVVAGLGALHAQSLPNLFPFPNASGLLETYNAGGGSIDLNNPFFQSLGTNGRSCGSCHRPGQGWSISAAEVRFRFELTQGLDPIFRTNDGSNCDHNIDTSTVGGRRKAYSLLIEQGTDPDRDSDTGRRRVRRRGRGESLWLWRPGNLVHVPASLAHH